MEPVVDRRRARVAVGIVARVALEHRERRRQVGLLVGRDAGKQRQLDRVARTEPAAAEEGTLRPVARVVPVAVRGLSRQARVAGEPRRRQAGLRHGAEARGVEVTPRQLQLAAARHPRYRDRLEVDRAGVRRHAMGARADTALHLHRRDAVGEIGEVGEVQPLVFRLVQRNAVEGDVDPRLVDAPQPHVRVVGRRAALGVRCHPGRLLQEDGRLLAGVAALELRAAEGSLADRGVPAADGGDLHRLEPLRAAGASGIGLGRVRACGEGVARDARGRRGLQECCEGEDEHAGSVISREREGDGPVGTRARDDGAPGFLHQ
jgi:hypothetical protein